MTVRFHRKKGVANSLRKIAVAQIGTALAAIADHRMDEAEIIHVVRQQLKCLRALMRLCRRHFDGFDAENTRYRDLARHLARTRDADVLGDTFDMVVGEARLDQNGELRAHLIATRGQGPGHASRRRLLEGEISAALIAARRRARCWHFDEKGFKLIGDGLKRGYEQMRTCEARAAEHPTGSTFHEWRKQVKYHANQLALLRSVAPDIFKGYRDVADKLAEALGEHHDLDMLLAALDEAAPQQVEPAILEAIGHRRTRLEVKAFRLGHELTMERPTDFLRRIESGWHDWRR
jgi:CHAD domain-containing protein